MQERDDGHRSPASPGRGDATPAIGDDAAAEGITRGPDKLTTAGATTDAIAGDRPLTGQGTAAGGGYGVGSGTGSSGGSPDGREGDPATLGATSWLRGEPAREHSADSEHAIED